MVASGSSSVVLVLGVLAALGAAVLYSFGVALQSIEAREAPSVDSLRLSLLRWLVTRRRWLIGSACVAGGWLMQAIALLSAPITIVQPALAISVVVLLLISMCFLGETVGAREVAGAVAIVGGVFGLVLVSPGQSDAHAQPVVLAVGMTALGAVALAPYAMRGHHRFGRLVVFSAGLAYAWTGFSTKFLADAVSRGAWLIVLVWLGATVLAGGAGLLSEMTALQRRSVIRVFPVVLVVQIVVSVLLAPLLAGESISPNPLMLATLAISLAVVAFGTHSLTSSRCLESAIATGEEEKEHAEPAGGAPKREGDVDQAEAQDRVRGNRDRPPRTPPPRPAGRAPLR